MAGMAKTGSASYEAPYPSALKANTVQVDILTATGAHSTLIRTGVTSAQLHITGGWVTMAGAGTLTIYTNSTAAGDGDDTKIAAVELAAAGTVALPPTYAKAGNALKMANTDGATIDLTVETAASTSGQAVGLIG